MNSNYHLDENKKQFRLVPIDRVKEFTIEDKKLWLEFKCEESRLSCEYVTLVIDRSEIIRDSFNQYLTADGFDFKKEIKIYFVGENSQDSAGLLREWLT